jgi:hypothetical protein
MTSKKPKRGDMRRKFNQDVVKLLLDGVAREKQEILAGIGYEYKDFTNSMSYLQMDLAERLSEDQAKTINPNLTPKHRLKAVKVGAIYQYSLFVKS